MSIKRSLSLLSLLIFAACSGEGTGSVGQPSGNALTYNGTSYPLAQGLADVYADTANHYNIDFALTDGYFTPFTDYGSGFPITIWLTNEARVEFSVELYSPGQDTFRTGTFFYSPVTDEGVDDPSLVGAYFFNAASYVGFDIDGDNEVAESEEVAVVGGSVTVTGVAPNYQLAFDLQLANGLTVTGSYAGEFIVDE